MEGGWEAMMEGRLEGGSGDATNSVTVFMVQSLLSDCFKYNKNSFH